MLDFNHGARRQADDPRAEPVSDRLNALIDAALMNAEKQRDRRQYLGASAIGRPCPREIQLSYINALDLGGPSPEPFPARLLRIFQAGHLFEEMIVGLLRDAGFEMKVIKEDGRQFGFSVMNGRFKGHVDGIIHKAPIPMEVPCLFEAKSLNNKSWNDVVARGVTLSKPTYAGQIAILQSYMDLGAPCLFVAINKDSAEIYHELVPFNAELAQQMSDRAVEIIKSTESGRLLPRQFSSPDHFQCRFCAFSESCWNDLP